MRHSAGAWSGKTSEVPNFRLRPDLETTSHSGAEIWDTLSAGIPLAASMTTEGPVPAIRGQALPPSSVIPPSHLVKRDQLDVSPTLRGIPTSLRKATF